MRLVAFRKHLILYNDGKENDHEKNFNDMFVSGVVSNRMWSVCFKK